MKKINLISKIIALKRRKISWERILFLILLICFLPEFYDQLYLARSRSVRFEIWMNSEGMSYQLGEKLSKMELQQLPEAWDCGNGLGWAAGLASISRGTAYFTSYDTERDPYNVYALCVKKFSKCFLSSLRVVEIEFRYKSFKLYEIVPGMSEMEAKKCLQKHGYTEIGDTYWKNDVAILLQFDEDGVNKIILRLYSRKEHLAIIEAYQKLTNK